MDIAINWDAAHYRGDWNVNTGDLVLDPGGLRSAVLVSLFTDRVASNDYIPPPGSPFDRRGWWGDTYEPEPIGSRLWQLNRVKKTDDLTLLLRTRDFCIEALQWLISSKVVATIDVSTSWLSPTAIGIKVVIAEPHSPPQTFNYSWAWQTLGVQAPSGQSAIVKPQVIVPPGPISNFQYSQVTSNSVFLSWDQPSVGTQPFAYTVLYRPSGTTDFQSISAGSSTSFLLTGLLHHTAYDIEIQVSNLSLLN